MVKSGLSLWAMRLAVLIGVFTTSTAYAHRGKTDCESPGGRPDPRHVWYPQFTDDKHPDGMCGDKCENGYIPNLIDEHGHHKIKCEPPALKAADIVSIEITSPLINDFKSNPKARTPVYCVDNQTNGYAVQAKLKDAGPDGKYEKHLNREWRAELLPFLDIKSTGATLKLPGAPAPAASKQVALQSAPTEPIRLVDLPDDLDDTARITLTAVVKDNPSVKTSVTLAPDYTCGPAYYNTGANGNQGMNDRDPGQPGADGGEMTVTLKRVKSKSGKALVLAQFQTWRQVYDGGSAKLMVSAVGGDGGQGGDCQKGGDGGNGGKITIRYEASHADLKDTVDVHNEGGHGGAGGASANGCAGGPSGRDGRPGPKPVVTAAK